MLQIALWQKMAEITREDWLRAGLRTLDRTGFDQLKISSLCQSLKVTKGSFYHWFDSKRDYDFSLLAYWQNLFTEEFIRFSESGDSSREKLTRLIQQCINNMKDDSRLEIEINMWAKQNDEVNVFVLEVYKQRFDYLMGLLNDIYPDKIVAKRHGLILYCLFIGVDLFYRKLD